MDTNFIEKDIVIDERIEEIFRKIEGNILKETLDTFAKRDDEIRGLKKCIDQIDEMREIYTKELKGLIDNKNNLIQNGISKEAYTAVLSDLNKLIIHVNEYENFIRHMVMRIQNLTQRLKDNDGGQVLKQIIEGIHTSYNNYIANNQEVISELRKIKEVASAARN